jgi:predicted component of type VI protein secretion system
MANPTKVIVDCSTGISEVIELTDEEVAQLAADAAIAEAQRVEREAEEAAKATARTALLKKLGITKEEAALLLG